MDAADSGHVLEQGSPQFRAQVEAGCRHAAGLVARIEAGDERAVLSLIRKAWVETELPSACPQVWRWLWETVRDSPHRNTVMSLRERRRLAKLAEHVTVYRGAATGGERGWSWTLDRAVAQDFAVRYAEEGSGNGVICTAHIARSAIIALLALGGEDEVVLDPAALDWSQVKIVGVHPG